MFSLTFGQKLTPNDKTYGSFRDRIQQSETHFWFSQNVLTVIF